MKIPYNWTYEFIEQKIKESTLDVGINNAKIKIISYYSKDIEGLEMNLEILPFDKFYTPSTSFEVDVFKDQFSTQGIISSVNCFKPELKLASIYAKENDLDDVILLNYNKKISRTIFGDLALIIENKLLLIDHQDGSTQQVLTNLVEQHFKKQGYEIEYKSISPFETQFAQEIFIISESHGIIPITKIRNKDFPTVKLSSCIESFDS